MKVFAWILLALSVLLVIIPVVALAESAPAAGEPYDWVRLATVPGAIAATLLIVQYFKMPLDRIWKIPTRVVVFLISFGVLVAAKAATDGIVSSDWLLIVVNTFVVGTGAMGAYELSFSKLDK